MALLVKEHMSSLEDNEKVKKTGVAAEQTICKKMTPVTLLLQSLAFSGVPHTEVLQKYNDMVITQHIPLGRISPVSLLG